MVAPSNLSSRWLVKVMPIGHTRDNDSGCGSGTWQRWGLVPVDSRGLPVYRFRDGKPRPVHRPTSGAEAPMWLRRAAGFVASFGPMRLHELADVAEWYRGHRVGGYPIDRLDTLASE